jgi:hypothetical protein
VELGPFEKITFFPPDPVAEARLSDHALSKEQQVVVGIVFVGLGDFDGELVCVDEAVL